MKALSVGSDSRYRFAASYVNNDPLDEVDPAGLQTTDAAVIDAKLVSDPTLSVQSEDPDANLRYCWQSSSCRDNANTGYVFFLWQGFTKPQSAGIIGNAIVESAYTMDPRVTEYGCVENPPYKACGHGISQWTGSRWNDHEFYPRYLVPSYHSLVGYAFANHTSPDQLLVQLDYIRFEINRLDLFQVKEALNAAGDNVDAASDAVMDHYERPAGYEQNNSAGLRYERRRASEEVLFFFH